MEKRKPAVHTLSVTSENAHHKVVNEHFESRAQHWRDVYFRTDLKGRIRRERQSAALTMVDKIKLSPQARILEVGCGAGLTTALLAKRGYYVVGIDSVQSMLDLAREQIDKAGMVDRVRLIRQDVHDMNFTPGEFDLVLALGVISWSERPEEAIRRMIRVVRSGGHLILTVDNYWCLNQILDPRCFPGLRSIRWKVADVLDRVDVRHSARPRYRYYSIPEFDTILYRAGLKKRESVTVGFGPFTLFNRRIFRGPVEVRVHDKLQSFAYLGCPVIRSTGVEYVVLTRKPQGF